MIDHGCVISFILGEKEDTTLEIVSLHAEVAVITNVAQNAANLTHVRFGPMFPGLNNSQSVDCKYSSGVLDNA